MKLWIIAGPNGAGKTTVCATESVRQLLGDLAAYNPDRITRELFEKAGWSSFEEVPPEELRRLNLIAVQQSDAAVRSALDRGEAVLVETVLSSDKFRSLVRHVLDQGGEFHLIYVALRSPDLSAERVKQRVREGGHDVPAEKLPSRWRRSLDNLSWFAECATSFLVVDNSNSDPDISPQMIARGGDGVLIEIDENAFPEVLDALRSLPKQT